jgi:hypothetical protein
MIKNYKGYCCNFFVDKNKDKFLKNSFLFQQKIPVLYEHKFIIGHTTKIIEDHFGLYVEFQIFNKNKIINTYRNLSIGFECLDAFKKNYIRYIKKAKILEISIVKNPSQIATYFY